MARTHVALLRGVNVGGGNKLPMADLRRIADDLGFTEVATHIASGNLVFHATGSAADLRVALEAAIRDHLGKPVHVVVLPAAEFVRAVEQCPYSPTEDKFVHLQVHDEPLSSVVVRAVDELLKAADDGTEAVAKGRILYLHTPRGLSKSVAFDKLPRLMERANPGTARNLNSSRAIARLLQE